MHVRRALKTDYQDLCNWWVGHGWSAIPEHILPFGLIVEKDGKKLAAGFLYIAGNAPVAYLEYIVSNPENNGTESYRAIDLLMEELMKMVKYNMIQACFARIHQNSLAKLYEKHGFITGDSELKDMIWRA